MFDYPNFISKSKSLLIAPAGYGKTHAISESLNHTNGKQLILTHTHAGISSIKEKLRKSGILFENFNVETISSFAQKYVLAFYSKKEEIPDQEDSKKYYPFIIKEANNIVNLKPVGSIISTTYSGLFVDEYQDCTEEQHKFVCSLANLFPTRLLGDHLQGIFDFNGIRLVDLDGESMKDFIENQFTLTKPWRWYNNKRKDLGDDLNSLRGKLLKNESIDLRHYKSIETYIIKEEDLYTFDNFYISKFWEILNKDSPLIIHPDSTSINPRLALIKKFKNSFSLLESIDDKDFYSFSKAIDNSNSDNAVSIVLHISKKIFKKSELSIWFNDNGVKNKQKQEDKILVEPLKNNFVSLKSEFSLLIVADSLSKIKNLLKITCYRNELLKSIIGAIEEAHSNEITVYDSMINKRNIIRRTGKKIYGNCIGTTLLTKGLEFDTVVLINAHKYRSPKHLYVALTRASKRLIVFTNNPILKPYK